MKKLVALFAAVILFLAANAQDYNLYEKHLYISKGDTLPYRLLLPKNYDPAKKYPLVFFMHGAGERGNDNEKQLTHGAKLFLKDSVRDQFPAIVVFPQCPANSFWANIDVKTDDKGNRSLVFPADTLPTVAMRLANELVHKIIKEYPVAKKQVYVMGLSMGGMGTFEMVRRNPKLFAAAMPICGGSNTANASKLTRTKWWVFHGGKDNVVPPQLSKDMVDALRDAGASVKFTLYPEANHNSWDNAFAEPTLLTWLFSVKK